MCVARTMCLLFCQATFCTHVIEMCRQRSFMRKRKQGSDPFESVATRKIHIAKTQHQPAHAASAQRGCDATSPRRKGVRRSIG